MALREMREVEKVKASGGIPVLKMPPDLALPALRVLASPGSSHLRKEHLVALRPDVPQRTLLNAYVLPSLSELRLYRGSLRTGKVTRFGLVIAEASDDGAASRLMARHLLDIDRARVGLVSWLEEATVLGHRKRLALRRFVEDNWGVTGDAAAPTLDRLGKWVAYLVFFGIVRETSRLGEVLWSASSRHIAALRKAGASTSKSVSLSASLVREALLEAYSNTSMRLGTKLYLPISEFRDELGRLLAQKGATLLDSDLDAIMQTTPKMLVGHLVSFAPFSGPARGGLELPTMYAGFISVRRGLKPGASRKKRSTSERSDG